MTRLALPFLVACSLSPEGPPPGGTGGTGGTGTGTTVTGWCGVERIFVDHCTACHSPGAGNLGGLDLASDPAGALIGVASSQYAGATLVVPGDAAGSLLYQKVAGSQPASEGTIMPPTGSLAAGDVAAIEAWITAGATSECGTTPTGTGGRYHPDGYADPAAHGLAAKMQDEACVTCHGSDLLGGTVGVSCDTCHDANVDGVADDSWRTTCTYCHGGGLDTTGAPPRDIDGTTDATAITFVPHHAHVTTAMRDTLDCSECHAKPVDVLSDGHLFLGDTTPTKAEVDFATGISAGGTWDGATCGVYCHSDGQTQRGSVALTSPPMKCNSCHASIDSNFSAWGQMSGHHEFHLQQGITCADCHDTTDDNATIARGDLHIDGRAEVNPPANSSIVFNAAQGTCTGVCHSEIHVNRRW